MAPNGSERGPETARGLLLVSADLPAVRQWAGGGLLPVRLVRLEPWTAVVPAGPSRAAPPYDSTPEVLLARPLPRALRPAIGLWPVGEHAVVSAHPVGSRSPVRWVVWRPQIGVEATASLTSVHLPPASPRDLVRVARTGSTLPDLPVTPVARLLARPPQGAALDFLQGVLESLGLPGLGLLLDPHAPAPPGAAQDDAAQDDAAQDGSDGSGHDWSGQDGSVLVEPSAAAVRRFNALAAEERRFAEQTPGSRGSR